MSSSSSSSSSPLIPLDPKRRTPVSSEESMVDVGDVAHDYKQDSFRIQIKYAPNGDGKQYYAPRVKDAASFVLPTQSIYQVEVEWHTDGRAEQCRFMLEGGKIGDREIKIISSTGGTNSILYSPNAAVSKGGLLITNLDNSRANTLLRFVGTSLKERQTAAGRLDANSVGKHNEGNIITLQLQAYKVVKKPVLLQPSFPLSNWPGFTFGLQRSYGGSSSSSSNNTFGGGQPSYGGGYGSSYGSSFGGSNRIDYNIESSNLDLFGAAPTKNERFVGGTTQLSSGSAAIVATKRFEDDLEKMGDLVTIQIQLVCNQPDEERELDNWRYKLHELGFDEHLRKLKRIMRSEAWAAMPEAFQADPTVWPVQDSIEEGFGLLHVE